MNVSTWNDPYLEEELDRQIFFRDKQARSTFLRLSMELMSVGYTVHGAVALLAEAVNAVIEEAGVPT
jgi:hypothetical protein